MKRLKAALVLTMVSGLTLSLGACSSTPNDDDGTTTVTMIGPWSNERYAPFFESLIEDYEEENRDVRIEFTPYSDQAYKDKLQVAFTTESLPDIFFAWPGQYAKKFVDAGAAGDLTEDLQADGWADGLLASTVEAYTYEGKAYAAPISAIGKFFAYNKAIFDDHDLSVPETVSDLISVCKSLREDSITPIAFGNQDGWPALHYLTGLNAAAVPADVLAADYSGETSDFDDPGYVEALSAFKSIADACFEDGVNGVQNTAARGYFTNGQAAIVYAENGQFAEFSTEQGAPAEVADNWDFFNFPQLEDARGVQTAIVGAPDGLLLNAETEHRAAAIDFLKFLTSKSVGTRMVDDLGWISSVKGAVSDSGASPQIVAATEDIENSTGFNVWLDTVSTPAVADAYLAGGQALLDGSKTPQEVMIEVRAAAAAGS